ncbi:Hypothetical protein R9X50_00033100 [Acrodontium crateriforme]|uniref:Senataxin n=1 Tax=Acrodontium crateriforme TaxID=150365 RepID=A0AAQ3R708_9PEZI|nr:Hypothetical protein R9X50_00033100 [Acrodontium crateriforme]
MADIVQKIEELTLLDPQIHWFCPRTRAEDASTYFDEDCLDVIDHEKTEEREDRLAKIKDAEARRDNVLYACRILAFDGVDAVPFVKKLLDGLRSQLTRCDICVRQYHRSRSIMAASLEAEYDADEVKTFIDKFDTMNIERIGKGLNMMTESLIDLPPEKRTINSAGNEAMYAMFEALNCGPFLLNEVALEKYFDQPFKLVQSKKKLKLPSYAPGMAAFIFSRNQERCAWGLKNLQSVKRRLTGTEFEHSVKPYLQRAMLRVNIASLEADFLTIFWKGAHLVLDKMTKDLLSTHLRAMDSNLYTLGLEHFQIDGNHFSDMIDCYRILLELNPTAFWDALGSITAQVVVETIFRSPTLERFMTTTNETEPLHLKEKFAWCLPFIRSMKAANLVPPVRALLDQLMKKFQATPYSLHAQSVSWELGLRCLNSALEQLSRENRTNTIVIHNMIKLVSTDHVPKIMDALEGIEQKDEMKLEETDVLSLDVIREVIALDIKCLAYNRESIVRHLAIHDDVGIAGLEIWKTVINNIKPGYPALAGAILSGMTGLLPLDKFTSRQLEVSLKKDKTSKTQSWNDALQKCLDCVQADLLEPLGNFSPQQLTDLYMEQQAAKGIISLLFSGESKVHQSALDLLKGLSTEDNRRDSLMHLIKVFFGSTLTAVADAQQSIANAGNFPPCVIMLKLSTDVFSCLTDSQDGVLRSKSISSPKEVKALKLFWETTWNALATIFDKTEPWSNLGFDKQLMQDFCRATMDFADFTFDQYSILANTLEEGGKDKSSDTGKALLRFPSAAFIKIAKWLRLRDEYLILKAVNLTSKILVRLQEVGIEVDENASKYVEDVVVSTEKSQKVKTKLSMNQKAELQRALEKHLGEKLAYITDSDAAAPKKQGTLYGWASSGTASSGAVMVPRSKTGKIDVDNWAAANDKAKMRRATEDYRQADKDFLKASTSGSAAYNQMMQGKKSATSARPPAQPVKDPSSFLLKRRQEKEAAERKKAEYVAKQKGLGAGSGVQGLGDMGKDHTLKGQNVMVSSDEESETDDDDDDLFGGKTKERRKVQRPNVDPNGAIGLRPEVKKGPVRIQRTQRSLKDMRARLAPDLSLLHKVILQWDFFHEGDYPPGANTNLFRGVSNEYFDPTTYQQTFDPLLMLEAWQGMIRSREETTSKPYEIKIGNRSNVDSFIEITSLITQAENRELGLSEGDVILLSKARNPLADGSVPNCLARVYRVKRTKANLDIVYQTMPGMSLTSFLTPQAVIYGIKVQSITPLEREYGALQGLQYYDLCQQIVRAKPSQRINFSEKQIAAYQDNWNVNRAQSEAINAALENEGFSLIQGPPGSGKTKTIIAIVGGLLTHVLSNSSSGPTKINLPNSAGAQNTSGGDAPAKKLLVCAPSNAAVDELVMRLKDGVKTRSGRSYPVNVVRIGRSEAINQQVKDVTMEELVQQRLGNNQNDQMMRQQIAEIFKEHEKVSARLRELIQRKTSGEVKGSELSELDIEMTAVRKRKNELGVRIDNAKDHEANAGRQAELNRKKAQQAVLDNAHVICATLSGSGHDMFRTLNIEFETVIIDEAAQCVEMSSLIPLKYGCVKCIMVGDPKQLPPTVFSKEAAKFQYEQSLFVRMQNNSPNEVHLLDTQYRMHPDISVFPSQTFYDGLLKDGPGMAALRKQSWHSSALLAPYRFFDVKGQHQTAKTGHSLVNHNEIEIAMALFNRLTTDFKSYDFNGRIGIITPYKSQLKELKATFSRRYGNEIFDIVEFNTTDAFQGRESEVIIFSCVRASPAGGIGFLQDIRRMNVGLTRAKSSLWVLGNSESLQRGQYWRKLIEDAKNRDCHTTGDVLAMLRKPSSTYPVANSTMRSMPDADIKDPTSAPMTPTVTIKDTDHMEGVTYRFQDRVAGKKRHADTDTDHSASRRAPNEDVEMKDDESPPVRANGSEAMKDGTIEPSQPQSLVKSPSARDPPSRTVEPRQNVGRPSEDHANREKVDSGSVKASAATPADSNGAPKAPAPLKIIRRQKAAVSPFMPKKKSYYPILAKATLHSASAISKSSYLMHLSEAPRRNPMRSFVNHMPRDIEMNANKPSRSSGMPLSSFSMAYGAVPRFTNANMEQTFSEIQREGPFRKVGNAFSRAESFDVEEERSGQSRPDSPWSIHCSRTDQAPFTLHIAGEDDKTMAQNSLLTLSKSHASHDLAFFLRTTGPTASHRRPSKLKHQWRGTSGTKQALKRLKLRHKKRLDPVMTAHKRCVAWFSVEVKEGKATGTNTRFTACSSGDQSFLIGYKYWELEGSEQAHSHACFTYLVRRRSANSCARKTSFSHFTNTFRADQSKLHSALTLSPVMLIAEEIPLFKNKPSRGTMKVVAKERKGYAPRPRFASMSRKRRSRVTQSQPRSTTPMELQRSKVPTPPLPSPPPNRCLPPTPPASASERPSKSRISVSKEIFPGIPFSEISHGNSIPRQIAESLPHVGTQARQRKSNYYKDVNMSSRVDARLEALEKQNALLSAALMAVLKTNGALNNGVRASLVETDIIKSPIPMTWERRIARRSAASHAASSSTGNALDVYMNTRQGGGPYGM